VIHYHGLRGLNTTACHALAGNGHAFVSFQAPELTGVAIELCQSFALDNGAFTAWRSGNPVTDWSPYYAWVANISRLPHCDFAVIPDVIGGSDADNDALLCEWPIPRVGAPVWHMNSSLRRLERLAADYPRVCLGSAGEYATVGDARWWQRMAEVMNVVCDRDGYPLTKLHGLRMLNPNIFTRIPLSSADSTNVVRNIGIDKQWTGTYSPPNLTVRAHVLRSRIESNNAPPTWARQATQSRLELF